MEINGKTGVFGVIGNPVDHTCSPAMHNAAYKHLKLNYIYIPMFVEKTFIPDAVKAVRALNIKGINVTIPYKEYVIPYLDKLDPVAKKIGAVNTIVNKNGCLEGYNTDGNGLVISLESEAGIDLTSKSIGLLGAGGSAKSIAFSLTQKNIKKLVIYNRTFSKARKLKEDLEQNSSIEIQACGYENNDYLKELQDNDIVINTTSAGMKPDEDQLPVPDMSWVKPGHFCCDIIYKPSKTLFLKKAELSGAEILNGSGMLAGQGVLAFELFTGYKIPFHIMKNEIN
ncbi:MAG: shikimate dehydrogenase [bacterium]|nr:shikimate dehydrogenase [bacterium]